MISPNHVFVPLAYRGTIWYGAEMIYQIEKSGAKTILVLLSAVKSLMTALRNVRLPRNSFFLFSDIECGEIDDIRD